MRRVLWFEGGRGGDGEGGGVGGGANSAGYRWVGNTPIGLSVVAGRAYFGAGCPNRKRGFRPGVVGGGLPQA